MVGVDTELTVPITKIDPDQRLFGGWAYVRKIGGDVVSDHSGDIVDDTSWPAMKQAFIQYALEVRKGDDNHEVFDVADLAELMIFDGERRAMLGLPDTVPDGVFVSFRASDTPEGDALWKAIKAGQRRALSIVGTGRREAIDDE